MWPEKIPDTLFLHWTLVQNCFQAFFASCPSSWERNLVKTIGRDPRRNMSTQQRLLITELPVLPYGALRVVACGVPAGRCLVVPSHPRSLRHGDAPTPAQWRGLPPSPSLFLQNLAIPLQ
jgi:hypothetical protein